MGEKWSKERRLKIQFDRLQRKIPPHDLLTYRLVHMIRENPDVEIMNLFKEEVKQNLILLEKVEEELGYNFYRYEKTY